MVPLVVRAPRVMRAERLKLRAVGACEPGAVARGETMRPGGRRVRCGPLRRRPTLSSRFHQVKSGAKNWARLAVVSRPQAGPGCQARTQSLPFRFLSSPLLCHPVDKGNRRPGASNVASSASKSRGAVWSSAPASGTRGIDAADRATLPCSG